MRTIPRRLSLSRSFLAPRTTVRGSAPLPITLMFAVLSRCRLAISPKYKGSVRLPSQTMSSQSYGSRFGPCLAILLRGGRRAMTQTLERMREGRTYGNAPYLPPRYDRSRFSIPRRGRNSVSGNRFGLLAGVPFAEPDLVTPKDVLVQEGRIVGRENELRTLRVEVGIEEYARVDEEYVLVEALVRARTAAKLAQAEVVRRPGTTQSAIVRLGGGRVSPSFSTLHRYAEATGTRLTVGLVSADD